MSEPASKKSMCICSMISGFVKTNRSLFPFKSEGWSLNLVPLKSFSSKL